MVTEIGKRIRKRRQVLGMTQADLARMLSVSESTVANWERGRHLPLRYEGKVEEMLGISLAEKPELPAIVAEHDDDPRVMAIWAIDSIPARTREGMIFYLLRSELTADA